MTTYNTYQEAKIANPECAIFERDGLFGTDKDMVDYFDMHMCNYKECNPADHCMTVEQLLKDGYGFVNGDLYLDHKCVVRTIGTEGYPRFSCNDIRNIYKSGSAYILRAAALEEKPNQYESSSEDLPKRRFKVEWREIEFDSASGAIKYQESTNCFLAIMPNDVERFEASCLMDVLTWYERGDTLYHRIETEITERDEFIEAAVNLLCKGSHDNEASHYAEWFGCLFDSGKFKLVEGE